MAAVQQQQTQPDHELGIRQLLSEIDGIAAMLVRLDEHGRITHVNDAWRRFALEEAARPTDGVGQQYLELWHREDTPSALEASRCIRAILARETDSCELTYRVQGRWFRLVARATRQSDGVVLTHLDVTALHLAETHSQIQAQVTQAFANRKSFLESCRELALVTCTRLEWDYMGIWTLEPVSWTLRCVDTWARPGYNLEAFERLKRNSSFGPGEGVPGRAWQSRSGTWVTDRAERDLEPRPGGGASITSWTLMPQAARDAGLCSGFAFPLKCDDDVLAVIEVFGRAREQPDLSLLQVLETSGAQITLAELRDRAERRAAAAESEAESARERLEALLDCAPAFVVAVDRHCNIQFLNRTGPGFTKDDVIGKSVTEFVVPADRPRLEAALQTVLGGGVAQTFDTRIALSNDEVICCANYTAAMHSGGQITGVVLIAQDVTEIRRTEAQLFEAQRLASIGTLAAGVAHEINSPLQFIGDNLEFLRDSAMSLLQDVMPPVQELCKTLAGQTLADDARLALAAANAAQERANLGYLAENIPEALELCADGLQRVTTIVRSLKEFSHPAQQNMVAADLNRAIMATLTVARNEYKYVAELETDLGELPPVVCHVNEINQTVLNIVINACHALADKHRGTAAKGVIRVRTRSEGDHVVIAIKDTANGIPESIRTRVFDPFFTTKEVGRGTGQGLAIAWNTVTKAHGGELKFESTPGEGTEFFIRLPVDGPPSGRASA